MTSTVAIAFAAMIQGRFAANSSVVQPIAL